MPFRVILVALDGSRQADDVTALACEVAVQGAHCVHLVCAVDSAYMAALGGETIVAPDGLTYPPATEEQRHAETILARSAAMFTAAGIETSSHVANGIAGKAIVNEARRISANLIVMGHRHLSALGRFTNPSIAFDVIGNADCPVLLQVRDALAHSHPDI